MRSLSQFLAGASLIEAEKILVLPLHALVSLFVYVASILGR